MLSSLVDMFGTWEHLDLMTVRHDAKKNTDDVINSLDLQDALVETESPNVSPSTKKPDHIHTHKHSITIAINDKAIDEIDLSCALPCPKESKENSPENQEKLQPCDTCGKRDLKSIQNLLALVFSYVFVFSATRSTQVLLPSITAPNTSGILVLFIQYTVSTLLALCLPLRCKNIKPKTCMIVGLLGCGLWIGSTMRPMLAVLATTAVLFSFGQAFYWNGQLIYLEYLFIIPDKNDKENLRRREEKRHWNIGAVLVAQLSNILGNLVTGFILKAYSVEPVSPDCKKYVPLSNNETIKAQAVKNKTICPEDMCGRYYKTMLLNNVEPTLQQGYSTMIIALICLSVVGVLLILIVLDKKVVTSSTNNKTTYSSSYSRNPLKNVRMYINDLLKTNIYYELSPLILFSGFSDAFFLYDYTRAYIRCSYGLEQVSFSVVVAALSRLGIYIALRWIAQSNTVSTILHCISGVLWVGLLSIFFFWNPTRNYTALLFFIPIMWGCCSATFEFVINKTLLRDQSTSIMKRFVIYRALLLCGGALSLALSLFCGMQEKLFILFTLLLLSCLVFYLSTCCRRRCRKPKHYSNDGSIQGTDIK